MFSQFKSRWRRLPWWGRLIMIVVVLYTLLFLATLVGGAGSWGQAHAATMPQPSRAWMVRGKITSV
jgi:hypothetical protein